MKGEIEAARARYESRTEAAEDAELKGESAIRATLSGFDLDFDEVKMVNFDQATTRSEAGRVGVPLRGLFGAAWNEALAIGLLIAEARAKGEDS